MTALTDGGCYRLEVGAADDEMPAPFPSYIDCGTCSLFLTARRRAVHHPEIVEGYRWELYGDEGLSFIVSPFDELLPVSFEPEAKAGRGAWMIRGASGWTTDDLAEHHDSAGHLSSIGADE